MLESLQEFVSGLKKEQRGLFLCLCRQPGNTERDLQATNCSKMSGTGFHLQTHGRIITLHANLGIVEQGHGGLKVTLMWNGSLLVQIHFYGSMENVSILHCIFFLMLIVNASSAGAGKSVIWYDDLSIVCVRELMLFVSSATVEDIRTSQKSGLAALAFFYCDFRDDQKKDLRGLLSSLLVQLGEQSDAYSTILSKFYEVHCRGSQQSHASDGELTDCLKDMLKLPGQARVHIIIDALDECPSTTGMPTAREKVLKLVEGLVNLQLPDLRICVTSRPEADIALVLDPLAFRSVSLHGENGQIQDITEYIKSQVRTDSKMRAWRAADKELVIGALTDRANGM